jgi:hypothetical protein
MRNSAPEPGVKLIRYSFCDPLGPTGRADVGKVNLRSYLWGSHGGKGTPQHRSVTRADGQSAVVLHEHADGI